MKPCSIQIKFAYVVFSFILILTGSGTAAMVLWRSSFIHSSLPGVIQQGAPSITGYTLQAGFPDPLPGELDPFSGSAGLAVEFLYNADTSEVSDFKIEFSPHAFFEGATRDSINTFQIFSSPGIFGFYLSEPAGGRFPEAYLQFTSPLTNQGGRVDFVPVDLPYLSADRGALQNSVNDGGTAFVIPATGNPFGLGRVFGGPSTEDLVTPGREYFMYGTVVIPEPAVATLSALGLFAALRRRR